MRVPFSSENASETIGPVMIMALEYTDNKVLIKKRG